MGISSRDKKSLNRKGLNTVPRSIKYAQKASAAPTMKIRTTPASKTKKVENWTMALGALGIDSTGPGASPEIALDTITGGEQLNFADGSEITAVNVEAPGGDSIFDVSD